MNFDSFEFLIFFPVVTILYFFLPHKFRWVHLLVASCVFYMAFIPAYILILLGTIVIDYVAGIYIERAQGNKKKWLLSVSIIANVGILCVFKYYNFFIENINTLFQHLHITTAQLPMLGLLLPIGLSFHTFQAMSYTIEVYRGSQPAEKHLGIYALYVMFYPQLMAGPIERPQNMIHQFKEKHTIDYDNVTAGLRLLSWGMFKKIVIADRLGVYVDSAYARPGACTSLTLLVATVFFAVQLYCDFSGYSDIALGTARVMGFNLMQNFNGPYQSKSITEFWRRWHISLSTWLNDYLFNPLSISFRNMGIWGVVLALNITFFLAGLWHGAGWNFVIFGMLNGVALTYELLTRKLKKRIFSGKLYGAVCVFLTFAYWCFCCVFFRSSGISEAWYIVTHIPRAVKYLWNRPGLADLWWNKYTAWEMLLPWLLMLVMIVVRYVRLNETLYGKIWLQHSMVRFASYYALVISILVLGMFGGRQFIYFQF